MGIETSKKLAESSIEKQASLKLLAQKTQAMSLTCSFIPEPKQQVRAGSQQALEQLLSQIRSMLISLLSYELQTPLSTVQTTVETLAEGDAIPAQAQREMIRLSLSELDRLATLVGVFLSYANQVWALTLDFAQFRPSKTAAAYLRSVFEMLPGTFSGDKRWVEDASQRLLPFLENLINTDNSQSEIIFSEERSLLEAEWRQTIAIINHELRTPFTTLKVCLETIDSEKATPADIRLDILTIAEDDIQRLSLLSQDLELLSRLASRQVCFRSDSVDLTATLQTTVNTFLKQDSSQAASRIQIEKAANTPLVFADGDRLVEVLKRLLDNASRFTAATGYIKIRHQVVGSQEQNPGEGSTLEIDVSDSGCGIDAQHLTCIFECFYQEEGYLRRSVGGMGIGLTICRYLVEGMGGLIWAESPGKAQGSRFCLMLPVQREHRIEAEDI